MITASSPTARRCAPSAGQSRRLIDDRDRSPHGTRTVMYSSKGKSSTRVRGEGRASSRTSSSTRDAHAHGHQARRAVPERLDRLCRGRPHGNGRGLRSAGRRALPWPPRQTARPANDPRGRGAPPRGDDARARRAATSRSATTTVPTSRATSTSAERMMEPPGIAMRNFGSGALQLAHVASGGSTGSSSCSSRRGTRWRGCYWSRRPADITHRSRPPRRPRKPPCVVRRESARSWRRW